MRYRGNWRKEHGGAFGTFFDFWGVLNWEGFAHVMRGMSDVRRMGMGKGKRMKRKRMGRDG